MFERVLFTQGVGEGTTLSSLVDGVVKQGAGRWAQEVYGEPDYGIPDDT